MILHDIFPEVNLFFDFKPGLSHLIFQETVLLKDDGLFVFTPAYFHQPALILQAAKANYSRGQDEKL